MLWESLRYHLALCARPQTFRSIEVRTEARSPAISLCPAQCRRIPRSESLPPSGHSKSPRVCLARDGDRGPRRLAPTATREDFSATSSNPPASLAPCIHSSKKHRGPRELPQPDTGHRESSRLGVQPLRFQPRSSIPPTPAEATPLEQNHRCLSEIFVGEEELQP